ncbi:MAG: MarC family protein [Bacteroidales bacterium]
MNDLFGFAFLCFSSFFTLINPFGVMPVFASLTSQLDDTERRKVAVKSCVVAASIVIAFALSGQMLFKFFGISVDSLRIVGGVIFFILGMDMLQARLSEVKVKKSEVTGYVRDISITPLAIPMMCGPGAITNGIVLMQDAHSWEMKITLIGVVVFVLFLTFLILMASGRLLKLIGETGNNVMMRLMGLIVMVIAVEFLYTGSKPLLINIIKTAIQQSGMQ